MGGKPSVEFDDNMTAEQIFELSYGTFTLANYNMIKNAILPIITDKPKHQHKKIYDDDRLPPAFRSHLRKFESEVELEMNVVTFIGTWIFCKLPINFWQKGNIFTGVSLFNKYVLTLTVPTWLVGFNFIKENVIGNMEIFVVEDFMFEDKKNPYIAMYRKRLVETYPKNAQPLYTNNRKWLERDRVRLELFNPFPVESKKTENPEELTEPGEPREAKEEDDQLTDSELEMLKRMELDKNQGRG